MDLSTAEKFGSLLPKFSGMENEFHSFIKNVESYLSMFSNENELIKKYCLALVKSKLVSRALAEVSTSDIPDNWDHLKRFLNNKFGDQINLDVLIHQLQFLENKSDMISFIDEIISMKIRINYRIDADTMPAQEKQLYKTNILKICKTVLISNAPTELRTFLIANNALTFDQTINAIKDYLSNMEQYDLLDKSRKHNFQSRRTKNNFQNNNYNKRNYIPNNYRSNYIPNNYHFRSNNNYNSNLNSNFPSQPIQFNQRPVNRYYPSNKQVFGHTNTNTNVLKPNPNQRINTPPEKMSVQTRVYPQKRPNYSTQFPTNPNKKFYSNEQTPNYTFEELTQLDSSQNKKNYYEQNDRGRWKTSSSNKSKQFPTKFAIGNVSTSKNFEERNFRDPTLENELT
ncbi:GATA zinc finger domain-containing protein 14-like [Harmonia axyridis]|uniref:GATA zinc finger domain-containing protein 14-like n=1 Tax=Harmonia axyridis TaxID=115357 RepID=UPI001E278F2F|nr:GATA zinc finger domain-containing protein 14-like [Harmonia axyridis]